MTSEVGITDIRVSEVRNAPSTFLPFRNSVHLMEAEASQLMGRMLSGELAPEEIAGILDFFRRKGETLAEITGFASAIRERSEPVEMEEPDGPIVDTCGTGGDGTNTFNISTAASFVVAGAGVRVAKHGNRKISSHCGSADVLEQLGVTVSLPTPRVVACLQEIGIGFFFAPVFHPAIQNVIEARHLLKGRTVFNLLGPLTNPVRARTQLIGAYSVKAAELIAQVSARLGIQEAFVVHGTDGLDEITTTASTTVFQVVNGTVQKGRWYPSDFQVEPAAPETLTGGDPERNAAIIRAVLEGEQGPQRDIVVVNAAAALLVSGRADDLRTATGLAVEAIDSGEAFRKLNDLIAFTGKLDHESI